jgi:hypothetical protein
VDEIFLGLKWQPVLEADKLTSVSRLSRKCGNLDISLFPEPPPSGAGIALPLPLEYQILRNAKYILSGIMRTDGLTLYEKLEMYEKCSQLLNVNRLYFACDFL